MKAIFGILVFTLFGLAQTSFSSEKDKSVPKETQKTKIFLADPFILLYEGTYYAYGTSSDNGFYVYTSKNLDKWNKYASLALSEEDSYGDKWFWAPEVYYNEGKKTFYMNYSTEEHICVATSKSPLGPFKQIEKKPIRTEKSIDSSLFIDRDGTPYLFFVRFTNGNVIWVAQLEPDLLTIKENTLKKCFEATDDWELQMGKVVEGPSVFRYNDMYYMLYSANDYQSQDYGVGYATATSLMGPWNKFVNNPILSKPSEELVGTGHGSMFFDKKGDRKYVFHSHFNTTTIHPRQMNITDISITKNGDLIINKNEITFPYTLTSSKK